MLVHSSLSWVDQLRLRKLRPCKQLVIVAHPDDETLWAGKTIAKHPSTGVLCLTNRGDASRRHAFHGAVRALGAVGVILNVPDRRADLPTAEDDALIVSALDFILRPRRPLKLLTHGPEGEYGHPLHQRISSLVTHDAQNRGLELWYFDFSPVTKPLPEMAPAEKVRALENYFPPGSAVAKTDQDHIRLSSLEAPTPARKYVGPSSALDSIYGPEGPL